MNPSMTFADILDRDWALETCEAKILLNSLPENIRQIFVNYFLYLAKDGLNDILNYFTYNSSIFYHGQKDSTSAIICECLYTRNALTPIDRYFIQCKGGTQIYQRLKSLEKNLPTLINRQFNGKLKICIDNVGAGTGREMIGVLRKHPDLQTKLHVRNIDPDLKINALSKKLVKKYNLQDAFSFINKNFSDVSSTDADLILLIGILCPFPLRVSKVILKKVAQLCAKGGIIVFSAALNRMIIEDPLTDCIMRLAGMKIHYKTERQIDELALSLGWKIIGKFYDEPLHYHCMVAAELPQ